MIWHRILRDNSREVVGDNSQIVSFQYSDIPLNSQHAFPWTGTESGWTKDSVLPDLELHKKSKWVDWYQPTFLGSDAICISRRFYDILKSYKLQKHFAYPITISRALEQHPFVILRFYDQEFMYNVQWPKCKFYQYQRGKTPQSCEISSLEDYRTFKKTRQEAIRLGQKIPGLRIAHLSLVDGNYKFVNPDIARTHYFVSKEVRDSIKDQLILGVKFQTLEKYNATLQLGYQKTLDSCKDGNNDTL